MVRILHNIMEMSERERENNGKVRKVHQGTENKKSFNQCNQKRRKKTKAIATLGDSLDKCFGH